MDTLPSLSPGPAAPVEQLTAALHAERQRLREFLSTSQARLATAEAALERQLCLLEEELQQAAGERSSTSAPVPHHSPTGGRVDWETEKQRILAAMETDGDNTARKTEQANRESLLRSTERTLAERDSEIQTLRRQLDERPGDAGVANNSAGIEEILEADAVIREERERLRQLQAEWCEKMRQAEIDLSVERARLARQRAELEERAQHDDAAASKRAARPGEANPAERPVRRRWLAQLGITDDDSDHPSRR